MTSSTFTFKRSDALEALLTQSDHFLLGNSYKELMDNANRFGLSVPILSLEEDGSTSLSICHRPYLSDDLSRGALKEATLRMTVSTIVSADKTFDPIHQTDVEIMTSFPSTHTVKAKIPSVIELAHADSFADLTTILEADIKSSSHAKHIPTSVMITPAILERIISDRCINPTQILSSVLSWMRENGITRGPQGGKLTSTQIQMYAKEIISFLTLANLIFESRGEDGENDEDDAILSLATLKSSSPTILESLSDSDKFSIAEFKGQALVELGVDLDHLNSGIRSDNISAVQSVRDNQQENSGSLSSAPAVSVRVNGTSSPINVDAQANPSTLGSVPRKSNSQQPSSSAASSSSQSGSASGQSSASKNSASNQSSQQPSTSSLPKSNQQGNSSGQGASTVTPNSSSAGAAGISASNSLPQAPIQNPKDAAMISVLKQMTSELVALKSSSASSGSAISFKSWPPRVQEAFLVLTSPDPSVPAVAPSAELLDFCKESTGVGMAQKFTSMYHELNFNPDIAMMRNIKRGNISMNESFWPGVKITGISPLSCPPKHAKGSGKDHSYAMAGAELLMSTNSLSEQDIRNLSFQSYFVPEKTPQLFTVMDNHIQVLKMVFTETSFIHVTVKDFYSEIKRMSIQLDNYKEKDGMRFFLAIQAATHTTIAIYMNRTLRNPSSASKSLQTSLESIINLLMNSTFMNMYALLFTKRNGDEDAIGNTTNGTSDQIYKSTSF